MLITVLPKSNLMIWIWISSTMESLGFSYFARSGLLGSYKQNSLENV